MLSGFIKCNMNHSSSFGHQTHLGMIKYICDMRKISYVYLILTIYGLLSNLPFLPLLEKSHRLEQLLVSGSCKLFSWLGLILTVMQIKRWWWRRWRHSEHCGVEVGETINKVKMAQVWKQPGAGMWKHCQRLSTRPPRSPELKLLISHGKDGGSTRRTEQNCG